jgi:pimeloyl-ACP methyl ester carboxylesterase
MSDVSAFELLDIDSLRERVSHDPEFRLAASQWDCRFVLSTGEDCLRFDIHQGQLDSVSRSHEAEPYDLLLEGSDTDWRMLFEAVPKPGYTVLPYSDQNAFFIRGDRLKFLYPFYGAMQRIGTIMRELINGPKQRIAPPPPPGSRSPIIGRYLYLNVSGREFRIYYEEAGSGIPLVLQHTAGADSRQWRYLLEDPEIGQRFRMIAYDLPFHGRSLPPTDCTWWEEPYRLTKAFLLEFVPLLVQSLQLNRPVFMGCSVGGHLAVDLAAAYPDDFRAFIGVNGGIYTPSGPDLVSSWSDPRIGDQWKGASMSAAMAPDGPETLRRETAWIYSQGAPNVFAGDIFYWATDHDLRGRTAEIDTSRADIYLLVGEYDRIQKYDTLDPPTGPGELAKQVIGSRFQVLKGLGHFPPSENPELFRTFLMPILDEIESASRPELKGRGSHDR